MNMEIANALEKIGLTKGEISVYLALLDLGETTTGPLIKKSKITGSKVYEILSKLIEKGFVGFSVKNNVKYFSPAEPELILAYMEKQEDELTEAKNKVQTVIPSIKNMLKGKQESQYSVVFEGWKGMATVFNMILENLKEGEEYYVFSLGDDLEDKRVIDFLRNYHAKRIRRKIGVKIIATLEDRVLFEKFLANLKFLKVKYYHNPLPLGVFVFKDFVATISFKETPTAFLIKSERVATSYKRFFETLWGAAKE